MKYRRKPVLVKVIHWTGAEFNEVVKILDKDDWSWDGDAHQLKVNSTDVDLGDYIVKNQDGTTEVLLEEAFLKLYEPA